MRISDWSSDVCSSDLPCRRPQMLIAQESAQPYVNSLQAQANLLQRPRLQPFQPADTYPKADGTFSGQAAGTQPQADLDHPLALMSNDAHAAANPPTEQALQAAGRNRTEPNHNSHH